MQNEKENIAVELPRINDVPILHGYQAYETIKRGLFLVEKYPMEYEFPDGWVQVSEENDIIGETDEHYVTRLLKSGHGEWVGGEVIQQQYILPIGIHKLRLEKWLFENCTIED